MVEEKKVEIAEKVVQYFGRYIMAWRRLIQISALERARTLSDDEKNRKKEFVEDRKEMRDLLNDQLRLCQLYYCSSTCLEIEKFVSWDDEQTTKRLEDLPGIEKWSEYEDLILGRLRNEIQ